MTVIQKFDHKKGQAWHTWCRSLSPDEQREFAHADARQKQYRQEAIDQGLMTLHNGDYHWTNKEAYAQGKKNDAVWMKFRQRWEQLHYPDGCSHFTLERDTVLTIYTKNGCVNCENVKHRLTSMDIKYQERNVENDSDAMDFLLSKAHRTLPQIYMLGKLFVQDGWNGLSKMSHQDVHAEIELRNSLADQTL